MNVLLLHGWFLFLIFIVLVGFFCFVLFNDYA